MVVLPPWFIVNEPLVVPFCVIVTVPLPTDGIVGLLVKLLYECVWLATAKSPLLAVAAVPNAPLLQYAKWEAVLLYAPFQ